jgi:GYF domain 2
MDAPPINTLQSIPEPSANGSAGHAPSSSPLGFFVILNDERRGPFALEELAAQGLEHDSLVWYAGRRAWTRADELPVLDELLLTIPPPIPRAADQDLRLPDEPPNYTAEGFRTLYRWFVGMTVATILVPLFGTALALVSQTQRTLVTTPQGYRYYQRTASSELMQVSGVITIVMAILPLAAAVALFFVLLYRYWNLLQDGRARTTPQQAVGYSFIPFFGFYWVFVSVYGLALEFNAYPRRNGGPRDMPPVSSALALAWCVLFILCFIPYLDAVIVIPMAIVSALIMNAFKNAALALLDANPGRIAPEGGE